MTASITGFAVYQGLATSLDTLCAQAYGSGHKILVGLHTQRMLLFLLLVTIPISTLWLLSEPILRLIVPSAEIAKLAGRYLKILTVGTPGIAAFESGKRFLQAQGLFHAMLYVLLVCAGLNAAMSYAFVFPLGLGYVGAPLAVAITSWLLPLGLLLYVRFVAGRACWGGWSRGALRSWGPMIRLSLPGLVMILAEYFAFEVLTLAASYLGPQRLAAQSVLGTVAALIYQVPLSLAIAASTRIANLVGAGFPDAARQSAKVTVVVAGVVGCANMTLLSVGRSVLPVLFTGDEVVRAMVAEVLPVVAAFQLFDAVTSSTNGMLRGLGWQSIGGWAVLVGYYVVSEAPRWGLIGVVEKA